jgi:hypothetical protein
MLKSVLMAASWLSSSQIPTPLSAQLSRIRLNALLENVVNAVLAAARRLDEKYLNRSKQNGN